MNYTNLRKYIEEEFIANWDSVSYPVAFENAPALIKERSWCRLTILTVDNGKAALGVSADKIKGYLVLQIFVELDKGVGPAYTIADAFNILMSNRNLNGVHLYSGRVEHIGQSPTTSFNPGGSGQFRELTPGFFQINVKIPFEAI